MIMIEEADLSHMNAYKGIWALSTINKKNGRLHATHYAWPVVYGKHPLWIVCTVGGNFSRYAGSREQVAAAYPRLVWRRTMARWSLLSAVNHSIPLRHEELAESLGKKPPKHIIDTPADDAVGKVGATVPDLRLVSSN